MGILGELYDKVNVPVRAQSNIRKVNGKYVRDVECTNVVTVGVVDCDVTPKMVEETKEIIKEKEKIS